MIKKERERTVNWLVIALNRRYAVINSKLIDPEVQDLFIANLVRFSKEKMGDDLRPDAIKASPKQRVEYSQKYYDKSKDAILELPAIQQTAAEAFANWFSHQESFTLQLRTEVIVWSYNRIKSEGGINFRLLENEVVNKKDLLKTIAWLKSKMDQFLHENQKEICQQDRK